MKFKKGEWLLIAFNVIYILIFAIFYFSIQNYEFLLYIGVVVIIALALLFSFKKLNLDYLALWGLSIWGFVHMIGGGVRVDGNVVYALRIFEIFDRGGGFFILKMDQVIHFYGFAVAALVLYQIAVPYLRENKKAGLAIFLAFLGSMGFGAFNEMVEFIAFVSFKETGVGDLYNTGLDLIFNFFGAIFGAFASHYWNKRKANNKA